MRPQQGERRAKTKNWCHISLFNPTNVICFKYLNNNRFYYYFSLVCLLLFARIHFELLPIPVHSSVPYYSELCHSADVYSVHHQF